jgi:hypothetical protein
VGISVYTVTIDCAEPKRLSEFWAALLDFNVEFDSEDEVAIEPRDGSQPTLLFIKVPDSKVAKNRIHLDLNPEDQAAEVRRAKELGAAEVDIGQKDVTWIVMADPEGNEFCILTPR